MASFGPPHNVRSQDIRLAALERSDSVASPATGSDVEASDDAGYFGGYHSTDGFFESNPPPESFDEMCDIDNANADVLYLVPLRPSDGAEVPPKTVSNNDSVETPSGGDHTITKTPTVRFASNAHMVPNFDLDTSTGGSTLGASTNTVPQPVTIPMRLDDLSEPGHITVVYPDQSSPRNILAYDEEELQLGWSNELLVSPLADSEGGARQIGLESGDAAKRLVEHCREVLSQYARDIPLKVPDLRFFQLPSTLSSLVALLLLLVFLVGSSISGNFTQSRYFAAPVEISLVFAAIIVNAWLYVREERLVLREMPQRAEGLVQKLREGGMNMIQEVRIPSVPSVSSSRVVRDGVIRTFPHTLLVAGDIVELAYGDRAPCRCRYVYSSEATEGLADARPVYELKGGELFRPALFNGKSVGDQSRESNQELPGGQSTPLSSHQSFTLATAGTVQVPGLHGGTPKDSHPRRHPEIPPPSSPQHHMSDEFRLNNGRFQFLLLETPGRQTLHDAFSHNRPDSIIENQLRVVNDFFLGRLLPCFFALAFAVALVRFFARDRNSRSGQLWEEIFALPIYTVLPLVPLTVPAILLAARALGNAQVLTLFDALQQSREEYEDEDDVDEFDVAPPPTKDVDLDPTVVFNRFLALLMNKDRSSLTRSTNLFESLGSATVICSLDKEGVLSMPFPQVEELLVIDSTGNPVILDVSEQPSALHGVLFEDSDWQAYMPCLKPLGLNLVLDTNCGFGHGRKRNEPHRKLLNMHLHGRTRPARQTCLCRLSRAMGFVPEAVQNFNRYREIYTFAPHHHSIRDGHVYGYAYEVPSMYSQILHADSENGSPNDEWLVMSDGTLDLVLECCADYWGGDHLGTLDDTVERKVLDYYHTAIENDMQVIAFSYRPIQYGTDLPILHMQGEQLPVYLELPGSGYPRRDSKGSIEHHRRNSKGSLVELTFESLGDYATIPSAKHMQGRLENGDCPPESSAKIAEQNQEIAPSSTASQNFTDPLSAEVPRTNTGFSETNGTANRTGAKKKRKPRKRVVSAVDMPHKFAMKDEKVFFHEVIKGQTFLGVAVLSTHHPKPNVSDFIEDLKLAGIRFVFFSPAPERESKAYAERLGLETDWNTCILLSDDAEGGYRELHDIKARLPRGIVNIRHHLQDVDDIPLHVSLFAECSPESTEEMIRVFQEYGEVVCCIGSALNSANTAAFATADVSVAIEPVHTRSANRHGRHLPTSTLPPLALGASLNSLPCALFMQADTSVYTLTQVIREARTITSSARQAFMWLIASHTCLSAVMLLGQLFLVPTVFQGYQLLWVTWIVLPFVAFSMLFTAHDPEVMTQMPAKNIGHLKDRTRFLVYLAIRITGPVLGCVATFVLSLASFTDGDKVRFDLVALDSSAPSWTQLSGSEQGALLASQSITLFFFVFYIVLISITFIHRTKPITQYQPWKYNKTWLVC
ncbi:hypothetical protein M427DRAFT_108458, partial [Gonapodya prolifera JEL478]